MKRYRKRKYGEEETLVYSDRSRVRIWLRDDGEGYRIIVVGTGTWSTGGLMIERSDYSILCQLEDYNDIVNFLMRKKYKVARRWFLRYLKKEFSFSGHNISEFLLPSSPYISWRKVHKADGWE